MLVPDGSSYRAVRSTSEQRNEFLTSADPWFRPARVLIGPDGHLYIADMYRETIEHPQWIPDAWQAQLDLRAGADRGRLYRVSKINGSSVTRDIRGDATTKQLVDALRSPIGPTRDLAQQWLLERNDPIAWPLLKSLTKEANTPHAQVHALSILNFKNKLDRSLLISALQSDHSGVLITAIRLAEPRIDSADTKQILQQLEPLASHSDPQVRLQVALTLGQSNDARAAKTLLTLVRNGDLDRWLIQAISSSAGLHATAILDDLFSEAHAENLATVPAALVTDLLSTAEARGVNVATRYGKLFATTKIDIPQQLQLAACFTNALKERPASQHPLHEQLQPLYEQAKRWIKDSDRDESHRQAALNLVGIGIGEKEEERQLLLDLVSPQTPLVLQQNAIDRLSRLGDTSTCVAFVDRWESMSDSVRSECVGQILQRRNWIEILLDALEQGTIQAADLSPAARQQLTQTGSRSMRVKASRLVATNESLGKRELINHYRDQMGNRGDRTRGAKLFQQHCAVCHVAKDQTTAVGASLQNLTDRSVATLLTAILDPNRAISPQYQSYLVRTQDDRILMGIIEQEAGQSITLAHADGRRTTLRRDQITELKNSGTSLMPEGLQDTLPPHAMRDLIEYLQNQ